MSTQKLIEWIEAGENTYVANLPWGCLIRYSGKNGRSDSMVFVAGVNLGVRVDIDYNPGSLACTCTHTFAYHREAVGKGEGCATPGCTCNQFVKMKSQ